jgi:hypothetical protein
VLAVDRGGRMVVGSRLGEQEEQQEPITKTRRYEEIVLETMSM